MRVRRLESIDDVRPTDWDSLSAPLPPVLRHAWLAALEATGCVSPTSGWTPRHLVLEADDGKLLAALPLYEKTHSFGEFVFDWAWAEAWHRLGRSYYPKLVSAAPFAPVTGPRLLLAPGASPAAGVELAAAAEALCAEHGLSGVHCLYPDAAGATTLEERGWLERRHCRYLWRNPGDAEFSVWLNRLRAKKRKNLLRERRRIVESGIRHRVLTGDDLAGADWRQRYPLYAATYLRRGMAPYLTRPFFERVCADMPEQIVLIEALAGTRLVGLAFCLRDDSTLYGRHWGCLEGYHTLHFETCYYQGMEYCLHEGLQAFDPGIQGEHKAARGFEPLPARSMHWLAEFSLRSPLSNFLAREASLVEAHIRELKRRLPWRRGPDEASARS
jgi:predicted N-acyltransferase